MNLLEGEGVGTAYEYYVKLRKVKKFIGAIEKPESILIAGLPEKYGLSMDFILLGQMLQAETLVLDDRDDRLERSQKVLSILESRSHLNHRKVTFLKADSIEQFNHKSLRNRKIDLVLSSEVYQRLNGHQDAYISNLKQLSKHFAVFAPNRANTSHAKLSGLRSVYLSELLTSCQRGQLPMTIYDCGYLDLPPFPPGLSRSKEKREQASTSRLESSLMKVLEAYCLCEDLFPEFIKRKIAHIAYVMGKTL